MFLGFVFLSIAAPSALAELNVKVLAVLIQHQDPPCPTDPDCQWIQAGPPGPQRHTAWEWESIWNDRVNDYYLQASYNKASFDIDVVKGTSGKGGWFLAPHNIEYYIANGDGTLAQDALALADPYVDLSQYDRLLVMHNFQRRGGREIPVSYGNNSFQCVLILEDSTDDYQVALLCHELGHTIGLVDLYGFGYPGWDDYCAYLPDCGDMSKWGAMGPWCIMSDDYYFNQPCAWSKEKAGWIPDDPSRVGEMGPLSAYSFSTDMSVYETTVLGRNLLKIRFVNGSTFYGFYVECRRKRPGDDQIPEEGVLVTVVDDSPSPGGACNRPVQVMKTEPPYDLCSAALGPGEAFVYDDRALSIQNLGFDKDSCLVRVNYSADKLYPDLAISDLSPYVSEYESPDIWVDSQMNGYGVYPSNQTLDEDGVPLGAGDPVWKDHENRICFRVTNVGFAEAQDIVVEVYVAQPAEIETICGPKPAQGQLIATKLIPSLLMGGMKIDWVPWSPTSNDPARIDVKILPVENEIHTSNNAASEAVSFYYAACSDPPCPFVPYKKFVRVTNNACDKIANIRAVHKFIHPAIPVMREWIATIKPDSFNLEPGKEMAVELQLSPPRAGQPGDAVDALFSFSQSFGDMMSRHGQGGFAPEPIGGLRVTSAVVTPSTISCSCPTSGVPAGSNIRISGSLKPTQADAAVAMEYTSPSRQKIIRRVTIDEKGTYRDAFTPMTAGQWMVQAFYQGDKGVQGAESDLCSFNVTPSVAPMRVPGDCSADGTLDISDAICVFGFLFLGKPERLPCGTGSSKDEGNLNLLDWQPDSALDLSDGVGALQFLFLGGPPHPLAIAGKPQGCVLMPGCAGDICP